MRADGEVDGALQAPLDGGGLQLAPEVAAYIVSRAPRSLDDLLHLLAVAGWTLQKGLFMMGHAIELANLWLAENVFAPLITQTNNQMQVTVSMGPLLEAVR